MVGNAGSARSLLKRACEYTKDNPSGILNYAIEFERKYGTLEDLEHFESKQRERNTQAQLHEKKMEEEAEASHTGKDRMEEESRGPRGKKRNYEEMKQNNDGTLETENSGKRTKLSVLGGAPAQPDRQVFADMK